MSENLGTSWIAVVALVLSGVALVKDQIVNHLRRPRLWIEYDPDKEPMEFIRLLKFDQGNEQIRYRVRVHNSGRKEGERCRADIRLHKIGERTDLDIRYRRLVWDGAEREKDIGANDDELLLVVFADSRFKGSGFVCKHDALFSPYEEIIHKYSFDLGSYEATLTVRTKDGYSAEKMFSVTVPENWEDFIMEAM